MGKERPQGAEEGASKFAELWIFFFGNLQSKTNFKAEKGRATETQLVHKYFPFTEGLSTITSHFIVGQLPWEIVPDLAPEVLNFQAKIPDQFLFLAKNKKDMLRKDHGAGVSYAMTYAINQLNAILSNPKYESYFAEVEEKKKEILKRAAQMGVPLREHELSRNDWAEYKQLVRKAESSHIDEELGEDDEIEAGSWRISFRRHHSLESLPEEFQLPFDEFLKMRDLMRFNYWQIKKKHLKEIPGKANSIQREMAEHISHTYDVLTILQKGIIHRPNNEFKKNTKLSLEHRTTKKDLIKMLDESTELLYDVFAAPAHRGLILKDPKGSDGLVPSLEQTLRQLLTDEIFVAGKTQVYADMFLGARKKEEH